MFHLELDEKQLEVLMAGIACAVAIYRGNPNMSKLVPSGTTTQDIEDLVEELFRQIASQDLEEN